MDGSTLQQVLSHLQFRDQAVTLRVVLIAYLFDY
ncbi:unnamed protein product [Brassica rapa subsp. trilocularis]